MPNVVLVREAIRRFTSLRIALISQFPVTINGMVTTPLQFMADRRFAGAGNAFNQIISHAHRFIRRLLVGGNLFNSLRTLNHSLIMYIGACMTATSPKLLDVVALTDDLPGRGLSRGQVGTVVETLAADVFEV